MVAKHWLWLAVCTTFPPALDWLVVEWEGVKPSGFWEKAIGSIKASSWTRGGYMPFPRSHNELVSELAQELIISDFQTMLSQWPYDPVTSKASLHTLHSLGFSSPHRFPAPLLPLLLEEHQHSTFRWLWISAHPVPPRDSKSNPEEVALQALPTDSESTTCDPCFRDDPVCPELQALLLCLWFVLIREGGEFCK